MKSKLAIIGASGHGKVLAEIALLMQKWGEVVFLDDSLTGEIAPGLAVVGRSKQYLDYINDYDFAVGVGDNSTRMKIVMDLIEKQASLPVLIHPSSIVASRVNIGPASVIGPGTIINCDSRIGKGVIVNTAATIDHDCFIDDYCHISPGVNLAGNVRVGTCSWVGIGSDVVQNISICSDVMIGAGSVVVHDVTVKGKYFGNPSRRRP